LSLRLLEPNGRTLNFPPPKLVLIYTEQSRSSEVEGFRANEVGAPPKKLFLKLLSLLALYQSYNTCNKYQQSYQLSAGAIINFTIDKQKHSNQYRENKT